MARAPVMAAGGIVLRRGAPPLIAIVRQRKRNEWVLPKGKLDDGETPREAAHREVLEETGHDVVIHEFLGTLVYQSGGRSKVVHFWRMEANGGPVRKLMNDIKAVDWLTLDDALARLSREYERAFLTQVGPIALAAAGLLPAPAPEPASIPEPTPALAADDIDAALQTLTPAEAASVEELRHGLLQKVKAWLRGEA
jgi:8-oxo-dGTP diphosphatase